MFGNTTVVMSGTLENTRSIVVPSKVVDSSINCLRWSSVCIFFRNSLSFFGINVEISYNYFLENVHHMHLCIYIVLL